MTKVIILRKIHSLHHKIKLNIFTPQLLNFAKFLRTPFLQNNSGRLLLKCRYCNNEARDIDCITNTLYIDCICCRELDAMLYC